MKRYLKVFVWVALAVVVLTAAQYSSVHLLNGRPSSWIFEASLDFGPPLLFAGDMVQLSLNHGSQAPLRDQPRALAAGVAANICLYGAVAMLITWLFFPGRHSSVRAVPAYSSIVSAGKRKKSPPRPPR